MKQNLNANGTNSSVKVHAIVADGISVEVGGQTFFLPHSTFPWFRRAKIEDVFNVELVGEVGVRWDALDVDLAIDSFIHPEKYPLVAKVALRE
ncbi:MAG: DUF2442 domain-containing protein [Dysgonamonadaceae bacterium]|jgi:hypothetical protein|nr:DUF2442 domain-containing protein [Dysgonamonadaceae bacterium]